eukprot:CAMPEP_0205814040 /NCGR_PEP_ID=MMETSP0205-20121125/18942_1 /ASSEMBLY_ACC=CAM_ASM_000278 /TAXON_ID=36767 /ORGANISM="Euplotes focardii, Strain TN1" /LENGTH=94 /DNA_ID=CAMNT_0053097217 /DNA_START=282 /DNA_END=565 /DNA_ORIENTATION=-
MGLIQGPALVDLETQVPKQEVQVLTTKDNLKVTVKLEDKYARGNNEKYMTQWSAEADNVDLYNKFQKPSSDGFDVNDLGIKGFAIRETDFVDVV